MLLLLLIACKAPPEAPAELSDLSRYLFREFENEDPAVLTAGMTELGRFFSQVDMDSSWQDLTYSIDDLTEEDVVGVERPARDISLTLNIGVATPTAFSLQDHAALLLLEDQTPIDPGCPNLYARTILAPEDPSCFPTADCLLLRTWNDILKENALMTIPYEMPKDYRWVEVEVDGAPELALLGRSWVPLESHGEGGDTGILQSFSVDAWWPDGAGGGGRILVLWSESYGFEGEDLVMGTIKFGIHKLMNATEEYLEEEQG